MASNNNEVKIPYLPHSAPVQKGISALVPAVPQKVLRFTLIGLAKGT